jgi:hypothetical protein
MSLEKICERDLRAMLATPDRYSEEYSYWVDEPPQIRGKPATKELDGVTMRGVVIRA